jgi:sortase A
LAVRIRVKSGGRSLLNLAANLLIFAGIASILVFAWALLDGAYYQYTQKVQFEAQVADVDPGMAKEISVPGPRPQSNTRYRLLPGLPKFPARDPLLIGKLEVPRIGLSVMVREGVDDATLRRAAGHLPSTALPGEPGNLVILGHRDTFFRGLRELEQGDAVTVSTTRGHFTYQIESIQVVEPDSIDLAAPASEAVATFITCFPFKYVGPAPQRLVARARLKQPF